MISTIEIYSNSDDADLEQIERSHQKHEWVCFLIRWMATLGDFDVFELYKHKNWAPSLEKLYGDRARNSREIKYLTKKELPFLSYIKIYSIYLTIKFTLISFAQYSMLQHRFSKTRPQRVPQLDLATFEYVSQILGNPLSAMDDVSLYLLASPGLLVIWLIIMPALNRRSPIKTSFSRFMLCPRLELNRLDYAINQKIEDLRQSIVNQLNSGSESVLSAISMRQEAPGEGAKSLLANQNVQDRRPYSSIRLTYGTGSSSNSRGMYTSRVHARQHIQCARIGQLLNSCQTSLARYRPPVYNARAFTRFIRLSGYIIVSSSLTYFTWNLLIWFRVMPILAHDTCVRKQLSECTIGTAFTWSDLIVLGEFWFGGILMIVASVQHMYDLATAMVFQMSLIFSTRNDLVEHRNRLVGLEHLVMSKQSLWAAKNCLACEQKLTIDALIKYSVFESKLNDNFDYLSLQVSVYSYHFTFVALIMISTAGMQSTNSSYLRTMFLVVSWMWVNILAVISSYMTDQVVKLNKMHWSILAGMSRLRQLKWKLNEVHASSIASTKYHKRRLSDAQLLMTDDDPDLVSNLWHNFAYETNQNNAHYCVRPLNFALTYKKVLELNFFFIFIYSLSLSSMKF